MDTVLCPHCGKQVEISQAIFHKIEKQAIEEVEQKHKQQLEELKQKTETEYSKKFKEQFDLQLRRLQEDAKEKDQRILKLIEQLDQLSQERRQLKKEKEEAKLEMQKKLEVEEEKIRLDAVKKAEEVNRLKLLEKDKQLADTLKELEDAKRKLTQGSQQLQGEAFELEFESILSRQYPNDKILPVGKGVRGGDIIQEVWDSQGNFTGKILWELKNTKTWSEPWIAKLKGDKRECNADEAVIISEAIPQNMKIAGFRNSVWVTQRNFVIPLADSLRAKLITVYHSRIAAQNKDGKIEILYSYLTGTEFKNRVEAIIEAFSSMQTEIEKEKRYFSNKWARDEKNIRQVIDNTYGMHGDLKGIIGGILPQIKGIELLEDGQAS